MKFGSLAKLFALILVGFMFQPTPSSAASPREKSNKPAYSDTSLTFEQRAADLVSRMTLAEKISQMQTRAPAIPRLGIPPYNWWNECLHGVAFNGVATVFPQVIGMAATWDPKLIYQEGRVVSTEARAKYNHAISLGEHGGRKGLTFFAPNINIDRDPRWGRGQETYGEDPYLTSKMAVAYVKGLQGNNRKYLEIVATAKHFVAYSGPEPLRHKFSAQVDARDLFDTYLPAFGALVRRGRVYSVMGAYSALNGIPDCADTFLLTDVLRKDWGFRGYVVSDCGAIGDIYTGHEYKRSLPAAAAAAVGAGCDLSCGRKGYSSLRAAVREGLVSQARIDTAVTRLMLARFKLGMFDPARSVPFDTITMAENNTSEHMELARKVADESIVLLKNAGHLLPLSKAVKSVAVIGAYANDTDILLGNYHGTPTNPITILQGIRNKIGSRAAVNYAPGYILPRTMIYKPLTVPSKCLFHSNRGVAQGLHAEYFAGPGLKGRPVLSRIDTIINFHWGFSSPGDGVPARYFSVRWQGSITAPSTNRYHLGIFTGQNARLYFNGKLLVNDWGRSHIQAYKAGIVRMVKGKKYGISVEYSDNGGYGGVRMWWEKVSPQSDEQALVRQAVHAANRSDVVIAVAGISALVESEQNDRIDFPGFIGGDRTRLTLPPGEEMVLRALYKTHKPVILVLLGGSALAVDWAQKHIPAIMDAWYPGEEGGNAVADVIFGDYDPAGKLPVTFYKSARQLPPFNDYSMNGRTYRYFKGKALYPFGYGLSYTTFKYYDLGVSKDVVSMCDTVKVSLRIENTGKMDGDDVVELYVKDLTATQPHAIKSLKAFKRVTIRKGETKTVELQLPVKALENYSVKKKHLVVRPGKYEIQIGASSSDIRLEREIVVN